MNDSISRKYKCKESFGVPMYDEGGFYLDETMVIESGTEWEQTDNDIIGGEIHLECVGAEWKWLEITKETLERCFEIE